MSVRRSTLIAALAASALAATMAGTALATPEREPRSRTCAEALTAWHKAQADAKDPKGPGTVQDGTVTTEREQASINAAITDADDPQGPGGVDKDGKPVRTEQEQARIKAAKSAAVDPRGAGERPDGTQVTNVEQRRIDNRKAAADEACKGDQGTPGQPGTPGPAGPAGAPGQPGQVIKETVIQKAPIVIQAPAPQVVQGGPIVTH